MIQSPSIQCCYQTMLKIIYSSKISVCRRTISNKLNNSNVRNMWTKLNYFYSFNSIRLNHTNTTNNSTLHNSIYRTHFCNEINSSSSETNIVLSGWLQSIRNFGHIAFGVLRDNTGNIQFKTEENC